MTVRWSCFDIMLPKKKENRVIRVRKSKVSLLRRRRERTRVKKVVIVDEAGFSHMEDVKG